jgi:hypothetical protein
MLGSQSGKTNLWIGVDLGVENLAVALTGTFWTGDEFENWRIEYQQRPGELQEYGIRWAHETMQAVARTEERRCKITFHRISNELLAEAREFGAVFGLVTFVLWVGAPVLWLYLIVRTCQARDPRIPIAATIAEDLV